MNQFVLIFLKNFIKKNWTNIPSVRIQIQVITSDPAKITRIRNNENSTADNLFYKKNANFLSSAALFLY